MASMKRPRLRAVQARPGHRLELVFIDGRRFALDMREDVAQYPGLKPLQNARAFACAALGDDGWTVEWPALDIQIGADTLYLDALAQAAPDENTRIFIGWRSRTGFGLEQAASALGVAARTISRYSNGREVVPRYLALACMGWEAAQAEQQKKRA
ncbi:DUF2442 domain-containing protein [Azotobacter chroococcum]|uniref:DUF2442 domain-containing protein n=1 Tax=Azotobacter chroococcum TaxID=353 RepID=A0AAQ0C158_9GAMM|nr:DUF2442 domain-containing protein [Azotobacter chroococcum]QQE90450.1 DUF2442 domain-containing protein [Azotobacter chroococcum]